MHNGKYQCHMAASCTYHLPTIITKQTYLKEINIQCISWEKVRRMDHQQEMTTQREQESWTEKQEIGKENRTTALRS